MSKGEFRSLFISTPMASTAAHRSTGWATGIIAAALASREITNPTGLWTAATLVCGYLGGTAPDWLENAWWSSGRGKQLWIAHRTWTHWGLAWIGLLAWCYLHLAQYRLAAPAFGFAAGGLMHLLADWPNPLGVPWLFAQRYSLRWWKSGRFDYLLIIIVWTAALWVADQVWWHGTLRRHLTALSALAYTSLPIAPRTIMEGWLRSFVPR